jgi:glyoxylase-like metal-dependent hydrolase (beta-lactamase superfamily II)
MRSPAPPCTILLLLLAGCSAPPPKAVAPPPAEAPPAASPEEEEPHGTTTRFQGDPRVGVYVSIPWGFSTSSYWIEGPDGLIVLDTQFLPSAAAEMVDAAEAATHKKVALAIVLHPNPDKFNGTATLQARGIKVVTSEQVKRLLPSVHASRLKSFYARYEPDYPKELPAPESFGGATTTLSAGGLTVKAHVVGPGCSEAHVIVEYDGHLFAGDLIASGAHSWLEIGRTDAWLLRLQEMRALSPRFVHPGRGPSGGPELLDQEESYLRRVIALVAEEHPVWPPPAGAIDRVKARVLEAYPGLSFPVFLNIGLPAEWRRQAERAEHDPLGGRR